jgi:uncharacterized protein (DUF58 family)
LWLVVVGLLLSLGIFKNINLLSLLGYVLLMMLVLNGVAAGRRLRQVRVRRRVEEMVFAGAGCKVELRVRNLGARARAGVRLRDVGPEHDLGWYLDRLEGHARTVCSGEVVLPRRGWYAFGPVLAISGYPFGLVRWQAVVGEGSRVLVLPRPGKLSREMLRQQLRGADPCGERVHRRGWRHEAAQADVHGLRPFRPGDSPRWIHWRTSARRGEMMVREMEDVPGDDLVLVLDTTASSPDLFEDAVTLTASIVQEWCRRPGDRLVLACGTGEVIDGVTGRDHARLLLAQLAVVETGPRGQTDFLSLLSSAAPRTAAVIVVAVGPSSLPEELKASLGRPALLLDVTQRREWKFYSSRV